MTPPLDRAALVGLLAQLVGISLDRAEELLHAAPLQTLVRESPAGLESLYDLTPQQAGVLHAGLTLGRLTCTEIRDTPPHLHTPRMLAEHLIPLYGHSPVEQFGIVALNTKNRLLGIRIISAGTLDSTVVHPRDLMRVAVEMRAAMLVLFHNHPSGDPTPSPDDLLLTSRLVNAGEIMGIEVVDHLILSDQRYFSFTEAGRMRK